VYALDRQLVLLGYSFLGVLNAFPEHFHGSGWISSLIGIHGAREIEVVGEDPDLVELEQSI
jgi:hypothetical protein